MIGRRKEAVKYKCCVCGVEGYTFSTSSKRVCSKKCYRETEQYRKHRKIKQYNPKLCVVCGNEFMPKNSVSKVCGKKCGYKMSNDKNKESNRAYYKERRKDPDFRLKQQEYWKKWKDNNKETLADLRRKYREKDGVKVRMRLYERKRRLGLSNSNKMTYCQQCNQLFNKQYGQKYCSNKCRKDHLKVYLKVYYQAHYIKKTPDLMVIKCGNPNCSKEFMQRSSNQKYCCSKCTHFYRNIYQKQKRNACRRSGTKICKNCGDEFIVRDISRKPERIYCSERCRNKSKGIRGSKRSGLEYFKKQRALLATKYIKELLRNKGIEVEPTPELIELKRIHLTLKRLKHESKKEHTTNP